MLTFRNAAALALVLVAGSARAEGPAGDPIASHTMSLEDATKGVKGTGTLQAKIEIEQAGKTLGTFTCELFEKQAPKTVANFVGLARGTRPWLDPATKTWVKKPAYDGLTFHRIIPDFMIQGGDPRGTGMGDPGYKFEDEFSPDLKFDKGGQLAMANAGPGTNGSQFFITEVGTCCTHLTGKHTIFGQCDPLELVKTISRAPRGAMDAPKDKISMKKVTIVRAAMAKKTPAAKEPAAK